MSIFFFFFKILIKEIDNTIEDFIKEKGFIQEMDNIIVNFTIIYYCPAFK